MKKNAPPKFRLPCVMLILDGFGMKKSAWFDKVCTQMPTFRRLEKKYASTFTHVHADGSCVGLPDGQVGNSEAGHAAIGAGRIVKSDQVIVDDSISNGTFGTQKAFREARLHCKKNSGRLHLIGLLTDDMSGHASPRQVYALLSWAKKIRAKEILIHIITDGRDAPPHHALHFLKELQSHMPANARIATVVGRYYAMDRNRRWERSSIAYEAFAHGKGFVAKTAEDAIANAYSRGESDEFIAPTIITCSKKCVGMKRGDTVAFWNLRSDRSRQLLKLFLLPSAQDGEKNPPVKTVHIPGLFLMTLTDFGKGLHGATPVFPHRELTGTFVEACKEYRQLYVSESEKFAQITYFFNGGYDHTHFGERRDIVRSPHVSRYDQTPRMSIDDIEKVILSAIINKTEDIIVANFANADMVAHTGNEKAALLASKAIDDVLGRIYHAVKLRKGTLVITADHGNIEQMYAKGEGVDTQHNSNPVPFLVASSASSLYEMKQGGCLIDIAPTILCALGIDIPSEMTGRNLLRRSQE